MGQALQGLCLWVLGLAGLKFGLSFEMLGLKIGV